MAELVKIPKMSYLVFAKISPIQIHYQSMLTKNNRGYHSQFNHK